LVHSKEVIRIVFLFDGDEPFVIAAVGFLTRSSPSSPIKKFTYAPPAELRMDRIVIALRPGNDFLVIRWIRIKAPTMTSPIWRRDNSGSIAFATRAAAPLIG